MVRIPLIRLFLVIGALISSNVHGDDDSVRYDQVNLSVSAETRVSNDVLVIVLFAQREAERQSEAADAVNEAMTWAIAEARKSPSVDSQTLGYSVSPVYKDRRIVGWRSRQQLELRSSDSTAVTELLGRLQSRLAIQSMNYEIGPGARQAATDALIDEAIQSFKSRAARIADRMGRGGYRLVNMAINSSHHTPPVMRTMAMRAEAADAVAAPAIDAGEQTVTVTINGTIELYPAAN